jgi:hypothetical protein
MDGYQWEVYIEGECVSASWAATVESATKQAFAELDRAIMEAATAAGKEQ